MAGAGAGRKREADWPTAKGAWGGGESENAHALSPLSFPGKVAKRRGPALAALETAAEVGWGNPPMATGEEDWRAPSGRGAP